MKKLSLFVLWNLFVALAFAQDQTQSNLDEYIKLTRSDLRAEKVQVITEAMQFSPAEAAAFWPVYNKYREKLNVIGDQLLALIKDYAENYDSLDDGKALSLRQKSLDLQIQRTTLMKKYLPEFSKVLPARRVARFVQIESQINRLIDIQIASGIPLVNQQ